MVENHRKIMIFRIFDGCRGGIYNFFFLIQKNFFLKIWAEMHNISFSNDDLPPTTLYPRPLLDEVYSIGMLLLEAAKRNP